MATKAKARRKQWVIGRDVSPIVLGAVIAQVDAKCPAMSTAGKAAFTEDVLDMIRKDLGAEFMRTGDWSKVEDKARANALADAGAPAGA